MKVEVLPIGGIEEVRPGADLPAILSEAIRRSGLSLEDRDVLVVTQKVVSKAEGRIVPEGPGGRPEWIARETRRVVARRGDLVIAETRHGFVCANAGVDASNVAEGFLTLLPENPDMSAEEIRVAFGAGLGVDLGVVVTDTFGRAWRHGLVNVAIGCAGLPALIDLRGTKDATGRILEATVEALADEVAAASGLVMGKSDGIPACIVRGVRANGLQAKASTLVRGPQDDMFRESPLQALHARRSIRAFGPGPVPVEALREAAGAACAAPAPHHTRPWLFVALLSRPARRRLLESMRRAWEADLRADGTPEAVIERRVAKSDALLEEAPALIVPLVRLRGAHRYDDAERASAEREMFLLSGGAAIQNLMLALHAQGLASCWVSSTLFCKEETREALALDEEWVPLGSIAAGPPPPDEPAARPPLDVGAFIREIE
jgi:dehydro coenzyme F420 reductase / coenzyme F420-0:L-glutamate ligase / coenzyme F420-1:gamma-L-glutamate ligase